MKTLNKLCASKAQTRTHILTLAMIFAVTATLTSCYSWFESKVSMDTTSTTANLATLLVRSSDIEQLDTPSQIFVSQGMYAGKILVSWTEVDYATSYRIEYAEVQPDELGEYSVPAEEDFEILEEYCTDTSYTHEILSEPSNSDSEYDYRYYYRVCAQNIGQGIEASEFTEIASAKYGTLFAPPTSIKASTNSSTEITVTWSSVDDAVRYAIYWGNWSDGRDEVLVSSCLSSVLTYADEVSSTGTEYYYSVRAINSYGEYSASTSRALGYTVSSLAPTIDSVTVTNGQGESTSSLTVEWSTSSEGYDGRFLFTFPMPLI